MGSDDRVLHLPSLVNETYALSLPWKPLRDWCTFPNLGKAACAQVRERVQLLHGWLQTGTPAPSKQGSHRRQQWPVCMCVLTGRKKKRDPAGQLMADYFLQLLKKNVSSAQPRETLGRSDTGWGVAAGGWRARSGDGMEPMGWLPQPVSDRACSSSTGQRRLPGEFRGQREAGAGLFPGPNRWERKKCRGVIWVANTCKSATGRFLSVEECGERGGRGGR